MSEERGFLTKVDREFLTGEREYTGENAKQQRYERREAIAARTRAAFRDFQLLYETLDEHERNRIFDVGDDVISDKDLINEFHSALVDTLAFIYLSLETEVESDTLHYRSFRVPFNAILQQAVKKGEVDRYDRELFHTMVKVEFNVEVKEGIDPHTSDRAIEKIADMRFNELTEEEMFSLLFSYDPLRTIHEGRDYTALDERIQNKRDELGVGRELSEEESEALREMIDDDTDEE